MSDEPNDAPPGWGCWRVIDTEEGGFRVVERTAEGYDLARGWTYSTAAMAAKALVLAVKGNWYPSLLELAEVDLVPPSGEGEYLVRDDADEPAPRCTGYEQHSETEMVRQCSLPAGHEGQHVQRAFFEESRLIGPLLPAALLPAAAGALSEEARVLAVLSLQSELYGADPEFRDAVDNVLAITGSVGPAAAETIRGFTPGPWEVQRLNHARGDLWLQIGRIGWGPIAEVVGDAVREPTYKPVAGLKYLVTPESEQLANAALIATAPDLLAENKRLRAGLTEVRELLGRQRDALAELLVENLEARIDSSLHEIIGQYQIEGNGLTSRSLAALRAAGRLPKGGGHG